MDAVGNSWNIKKVILVHKYSFSLFFSPPSSKLDSESEKSSLRQKPAKPADLTRPTGWCFFGFDSPGGFSTVFGR